MFGSPCNILSGDKRKRTICTFCVGNMKKTKTDVAISMLTGGGGGHHLGGGYHDLEDPGDTCLSVPGTPDHVSSPATCRTPASRGPGPYFYTSLEIIKEEYFNPYNVHTLPVN